MHVGLGNFHRAHQAVYLDDLFATGRDPNAFLGALRFALAFSVLLAPSTMMGATLPALVRHAARSSSSVGRQTGVFYAANTAGAVAGTLLAAFVLIGALGVTATLVLTGVVNFVIAGIAWRLGSDPVDEGVDPEAVATYDAWGPSRLARVAMGAFAVSGFCALA